MARDDAYRRSVGVLARHIAARLQRSLPDAVVVTVANPAAGDVKRNAAIIANVEQSVVERGETTLEWSESRGHARSIVEGRVASHDPRSGRLVVVSIGGDGTHNEVCSPAVEGNVDRESVVFLRVPLGSGNDGADAATLGELLTTLEGIVAPRSVPAVLVESRTARFTALNIASFGLDAFVTVTRERARRVLRGNGYKLVADAAVLFYERIVKLQRSTVRFPDGHEWSDEAMLIAFGASGGRSYGGHIHVLPDERNVCVISRSGIADKLRLKRLFYEGQHTGDDLVTMRAADQLTIEYGGDLHYQVDGEGGVISADSFPVTVKRVERALTVLGPAEIAG